MQLQVSGKPTVTVYGSSRKSHISGEVSEGLSERPLLLCYFMLCQTVAQVTGMKCMSVK